MEWAELYSKTKGTIKKFNLVYLKNLLFTIVLWLLLLEEQFMC